MVKTEPFLQWVIEDRFHGARLANEIGPWEAAKPRLLNGAHSAIAYLGGLAGIKHVHAFVARADGRRFVEALWDEAATTLRPAAGLDPAAYRNVPMSRFRNPALGHRTRQIAQDGSRKIPRRLVAVITERLERGPPSPAAMLAVAAWMRWQGSVDDHGATSAVEDPLAAETTARSRGSTEAVVAAMLGMSAIFPAAFSWAGRVRQLLVRSLYLLRDEGALGAIGSDAAVLAEDRQI